MVKAIIFFYRNHKESVGVDFSSVLCISSMLPDCNWCRVLCQIHTHITQYQNSQLLITHLLRQGENLRIQLWNKLFSDEHVVHANLTICRILRCNCFKRNTQKTIAYYCWTTCSLLCILQVFWFFFLLDFLSRFTVFCIKLYRKWISQIRSLLVQDTWPVDEVARGRPPLWEGKLRVITQTVVLQYSD